mmetsp:Transcript_5786/g.19706  ORF Transcript_5786/g.19706 Transcript_5786/m.19706 type:complete len:222 (+) Transcript_5786:186-851(+)
MAATSGIRRSTTATAAWGRPCGPPHGPPWSCRSLRPRAPPPRTRCSTSRPATTARRAPRATGSAWGSTEGPHRLRGDPSRPVHGRAGGPVGRREIQLPLRGELGTLAPRSLARGGQHTDPAWPCARGLPLPQAGNLERAPCALRCPAAHHFLIEPPPWLAHTVGLPCPRPPDPFDRPCPLPVCLSVTRFSARSGAATLTRARGSPAPASIHSSCVDLQISV